MSSKHRYNTAIFVLTCLKSWGVGELDYVHEDYPDTKKVFVEMVGNTNQELLKQIADVTTVEAWYQIKEDKRMYWLSTIDINLLS